MKPEKPKFAGKASGSLSELVANPANPRQPFTPEQQAAFHKSLIEFGDLSGIVRNRRSGRIVGGHKRVEDFLKLENAQIAVTERLLKPDKTGSIAFGYVHLHGTRYSYREVDWKEEKELGANLAANQFSADWEYEKLKEMLKELKTTDFDLELTGFDSMEMERILNRLNLFGENDPEAVWSGMPQFDNQDANGIRLMVHFKNMEDRRKFLKIIKKKATDNTKFIWWPHDDPPAMSKEFTV